MIEIILVLMGLLGGYVWGDHVGRKEERELQRRIAQERRILAWQLSRREGRG